MEVVLVGCHQLELCLVVETETIMAETKTVRELLDHYGTSFNQLSINWSGYCIRVMGTTR